MFLIKKNVVLFAIYILIIIVSNFCCIFYEVVYVFGYE